MLEAVNQVSTTPMLTAGMLSTSFAFEVVDLALRRPAGSSGYVVQVDRIATTQNR